MEGPNGAPSIFLTVSWGVTVGADDSSESDGASEPLSATVVACSPRVGTSELRNSLQFPPKAFRMVKEWPRLYQAGV